MIWMAGKCLLYCTLKTNTSKKLISSAHEQEEVPYCTSIKDLTDEDATVDTADDQKTLIKRYIFLQWLSCLPFPYLVSFSFFIMELQTIAKGRVGVARRCGPMATSARVLWLRSNSPDFFVKDSCFLFFSF